MSTETMARERTDDEIRELFRQAAQKMTPPQAPASAMTRMNVHGRYYDLTAAMKFVACGVQALEGIGNLMRPEMAAGDEQLTHCHRSDVAAVFEFFGEALKGAVADAGDAIDFFEFKGYVKDDSQGELAP